MLSHGDVTVYGEGMMRSAGHRGAGRALVHTDAAREEAPALRSSTLRTRVVVDA